MVKSESEKGLIYEIRKNIRIHCVLREECYVEGTLRERQELP